jgi:hypothetical protein
MTKENKLKDQNTEIKYNVIDKFKANDSAVIEKLINQKLAKIILHQEKLYII